MADFKQILKKLQKNLNILEVRKAKYAGNAPLDLLNQIDDYKKAIFLTRQAIAGKISTEQWRAVMKPLNLNMAQTTNIFQFFIQSVPWPVVIGIGFVLVVLVGIGIANIGLGLVAVVPPTPTSTPTLTPSPTVTPTATPLFLPAQDDETLILIAKFDYSEGVIDTKAHDKIRRAIEKAIDELDTSNLRVEIEPTQLEANAQADARALGEQYNADIIIWGEDTGVDIIVNYLNLKEPDFAAAEVEISETNRTQIANPDAYGEFITEDLPGRVTFLSLFSVGQSYYGQEKYSDAIPIIKKAINSLSSKDIKEVEGIDDAYFRLGWLYYELDDWENAIIKYTQAIALNGHDARFYGNRGIAYEKQKKFEQAIADIDKAIDLEPDNADFYLYRGVAYGNQDQYEQAIADFTKTIDLDPDYNVAYLNRGTACYNLGKINQDQELIKQAITDIKKAIEDFDKTIEQEPENTKPRLKRGYAYFLLAVCRKSQVSQSKVL